MSDNSNLPLEAPWKDFKAWFLSDKEAHTHEFYNHIKALDVLNSTLKNRFVFASVMADLYSQFALNLVNEIVRTSPDDIGFLSYQLLLLFRVGKSDEAKSLLHLNRDVLNKSQEYVKNEIILFYCKSSSVNSIFTLLNYIEDECYQVLHAIHSSDMSFKFIEKLVLNLDQNSLLTRHFVLFLNSIGEFALADWLASRFLSLNPAPSSLPDRSFPIVTKYMRYCDDASAPLLIFFSAFYSATVEEHYKLYKINYLEKLFEDGDRFQATTFFSGQNKFNVLLTKDPYQLWYLLNWEKFFSSIKLMLNQLNPSKIITMGLSAGGFSSLLYGSLLNADLSLAFNPQASAFTTYINDYRRAIDSRYLLSLSPLSVLPRAIAVYDHKTRYRIYYSKDNGNDAFQAKLLSAIPDADIKLNPVDNQGEHNMSINPGKEFVQNAVLREMENIL